MQDTFSRLGTVDRRARLTAICLSLAHRKARDNVRDRGISLTSVARLPELELAERIDVLSDHIEPLGQKLSTA
jgi:hypothetical protein